MPSDFPQDADSEGHTAGFTRHCPSSHFPLSRLIRLSCAPGNFPGRMDGGVLASRISSFSAGLVRSYSSVVFVSACPSHSETFLMSPVAQWHSFSGGGLRYRFARLENGRASHFFLLGLQRSSGRRETRG